jgi:DNA topoisomerase-1
MIQLIGGRDESYDIRNYKNGIYRKKINNEFTYYYIKNNKLINKTDLERIKKLNIPPAWEHVWVSIDHKTPIQAIGIDNKGRKQYKYNTAHILQSEKNKFLRLYKFIKAIPKLENHLNVNLSNTKLNYYDKNTVICTMLNIIKLTHMRVGKEQYARENKSYGISSLKKSHLKINGDLIVFNFKGKSNKRLNYVINNINIKQHLSALLKLEGDKLFQFIDENTNKIKKLAYTDLNHYIQNIMGKDFSIKDFRTYASNYHFIDSLLSETKKRNPKDYTSKKKNIINSIKRTAKYLKHTENISKKSYVMSFIIDFYMNNTSYFIDNVYNNSNDILINLLKLYKTSIKENNIHENN